MPPATAYRKCVQERIGPLDSVATNAVTWCQNRGIAVQFRTDVRGWLAVLGSALHDALKKRVTETMEMIVANRARSESAIGNTRSRFIHGLLDSRDRFRDDHETMAVQALAGEQLRQRQPAACLRRVSASEPEDALATTHCSDEQRNDADAG
mmetsp:Transcript_3835/g.9922  ORF Transcript_3835/g.9922 Transcript_3835/m.9922 type:complete len:152 (+) Transcript_3835:241-696(+)